MKNPIIKLLLIIGFTILLQSCSLEGSTENYCYTRNYRAATAVSGPETTTVNTTVNFQVTFSIGNSCGVFFDFAEFNTGFPKEIAAAVDYTGCNCNEIAASVTKPYAFTAPAAGTYTLHFLTDVEDQPIVKTIVVTE